MSVNKKYSQAIIHKIDSFLWKYGYRIERVRIIVRSLFLFNAFVFALALISLPFTLIPLSFSLASLLAFGNFALMARHIVQNFPVGGAKNISIKALFLWFVRLVVIIALSFVAIVILKLPLYAWLAGLGTQLFISPLINIIHK